MQSQPAVAFAPGQIMLSTGIGVQNGNSGLIKKKGNETVRISFEAVWPRSDWRGAFAGLRAASRENCSRRIAGFGTAPRREQAAVESVSLINAIPSWARCIHSTCE